MPTEEECERALSRHSASLLAIAGVSGVGITTADPAETGCALAVYVTDASVTVPASVDVVDAHGRWVCVPVVRVVSGPFDFG